MSHGSKQKKPHKQEKNEYGQRSSAGNRSFSTEPQIIPQVIQVPQYNQQSRNIGIATFSSISKQAEALLSGDNSVIFNNYTNSLIFRSSKLDMKECLNLHFVDKTINNVKSLSFGKAGTIKGISDGYQTNSQGVVVRVSDREIALSTAFGNEIIQKNDKMTKDFNLEVERRKYDDNVLLEKLNETSSACEMALRLINYIYYDTENHSLSVIIPYESPTSTQTSYVDLMPSETVIPAEINPDPDEGLSELPPINSSTTQVLNIDRNGIEIHGDINLNGHTYNQISTSLDSALDTSIPTTKAVSDELTKQVGLLSNRINTNVSNIDINTTNISKNASDIATCTTNITQNTSNIATNTTNISKNASDIAKNSSDITALRSLLSTIQGTLQSYEERIKALEELVIK